MSAEKRWTAEVYYSPYTQGISHAVNSVTKGVISTLTAIASKDGLLDSPNHRVLDFLDRRSIANVDDFDFTEPYQPTKA